MRTKSMKVINNELYIGKYKASELANKFQTPLYVYDEMHIRYKLDIFKEHFKSKKYQCDVVYATKAFLCPYLINIINEYGMGLDSVSEGDLYLIKKANFPLSKVVLHGNNKDNSEINFAINNNVGYIVADHIDEIIEIEKVAKEKNKKVQILLRVNPGISAHTHEYIQTSLLSSKFGESIFDEKRIDEIVRICSKSEHLDLLGFHCHIGSSIQDPNSFKQSTKTMLEFVYNVQKRNNYNFKVINFGGGFGIKYIESDPEFDLAKMLNSIIKTVDSFIEKHNWKLERIMIEPGRSVVGDAGSTLYGVGAMKSTYGGKKYVFVDGGLTDNIRPALYQAKYTVDVCNRMVSKNKTLVDVVGPCCESSDIVVADYQLGEVQKGDTLIAYCTGAYGYSMSMNYNGHVRGAVIFVNADIIHLGVRREDYDDLAKTFPAVSNKRMFDCHSDMLYDLWTNKTKGINNRFKDYHVYQLNSSVIKGGLFTMYSPNDFDLIEACKIGIDELKMNYLPEFKVILGLEGLRNLKKVEDIDILYNMGFRHAMVTWNEENKYATGAKSNPERGITDEGKRLLARMQDLGMIIDLAHLNEKSFYEALDIVNKNIIYSHGNCKSLCEHIRNVTDDQMKALKKIDGLLGLTLADNFIDEDKENRTMARFMEHVKHAIEIMGIDNVCFGFDFMDYLDEFANSNLEDVKDATFAYRIIESLESLGLNEDAIDKICYSNFISRYQSKIIDLKNRG